jgi:polysaccharide biosynthesis transport protein
MASSTGPKESASLADLVKVLRLRLPLIALIVGLVLVTTMVGHRVPPAVVPGDDQGPRREARERREALPGQGSTAYDPYFLQDQFKIMQSEKIIYPVIDKLGLNTRLAA